MDIHILLVCTVESFQKGFPQVVENSCGYVAEFRFTGGFLCGFPCFLPKALPKTPDLYVNFAGNSGFPHFRTVFPKLLKTFAETPQFSQNPQSITGSRKRIPKRKFRFPTKLRRRKHCLDSVSEKQKIPRNAEMQSIFRKKQAFSEILHPFFRVTGNDSQKQSTEIAKRRAAEF